MTGFSMFETKRHLKKKGVKFHIIFHERIFHFHQLHQMGSETDHQAYVRTLISPEGCQCSLRNGNSA